MAHLTLIDDGRYPVPQAWKAVSSRPLNPLDEVAKLSGDVDGPNMGVCGRVLGIVKKGVDTVTLERWRIFSASQSFTSLLESR